MAAVAKLELDASGYISSIDQARGAVDQFNESESAQAQALNKSLDALQKSADGTKTTAQQAKILKDELDKLRQQYANLTKEQKANKTLTEAYNRTIKETESRLSGIESSLKSAKQGYSSMAQTFPGLSSAMNTFSTATSAAGVSVTGLDKAMKLLNLSNPLGWIVIGVSLLKGLWDQFMKVESVSDFVSRTLARLGAVFETTFKSLTNFYIDFYTGIFTIDIDKIKGAVTNNILNLGDKIADAWKSAGEAYDASDLVGSLESLNRADLDAAKTLLDDVKSKYQVGKATKDELNKAIQAYKEQADVFEQAYKKAGETALKNALREASGLAGDELDKLTEEFIASTDKNAFIGSHGLGNFEQSISKAMEEYQKYVNFHKESSSAVREAQAAITTKTNAEVANRKKIYEDEQKEIKKTMEALEDYEDGLDEAEKRAGEEMFKRLNANTDKSLFKGPGFKSERERQGDEASSTVSSFDTEAAVASLTTLENKLSATQDLVGDLSSLSRGFQSLQSSIESFSKIENPFDVFNSLFGVAQNVMGIIQTMQALGETMQTISSISKASAATEAAAAAQKASANSTETASEVTNATAKTFNAHAAIPFVGIAIAATMVAAMIASMIATKNKAKKFAYGGIVPGNSFSGDKVPAWVNSGEMILNQKEQAVVSNLVGNNRNDKIEIYGETRVDGKDIVISYKRRNRFESRR